MLKRRQLLQSFGVVLIFVVIAIACRIIILSVPSLSAFSDKLLNYTRTFIYLGIFTFWGVSIARRVIQPPVKRGLLAISACILFWLIIKEFRYRYVLQADVSRYLWYMYYIPLLLIPLLAVFISFYTGQGEEYKPPKGSHIFVLISGILAALMLSNDWHQFAFRFHSGTVLGKATEYSYGWLYYVLAAWVYFCSIFAFVKMIKKLRAPGGKKQVILPTLPFLCAMLYGVLYALRVPFVTRYLSDLPVVFSLAFAAFFESCIQVSLIQSNTMYRDLFAASADTSMQIVNYDFVPVYCAGDAPPPEAAQIKKALEKPVITAEGTRRHAIAVRGGYAVWEEDISTLLETRERLESRREELKERNVFLEHEYQKQEEFQSIKARNALYDLLQSQTQEQLDTIDALMQDYTQADEEKKREILCEIVLLGTYIKRKKDFVLSMENADKLPVIMLSSAVNESYRALRLFAVRGACFVEERFSEISGEVLATAYDFFETVAEALIKKAHYINFRFYAQEGGYSVAILADGGNEQAIIAKYPQAFVLQEDDELFCRLIIAGGEAHE